MKNGLGEGAPQRRALAVGGHGPSDLWEQCFQLRKPRPLGILHRECLKRGFTITGFKVSSSKLFPGGRRSLKTAYGYKKGEQDPKTWPFQAAVRHRRRTRRAEQRPKAKPCRLTTRGKLCLSGKKHKAAHSQEPCSCTERVHELVPWLAPQG